MHNIISKTLQMLQQNWPFKICTVDSLPTSTNLLLMHDNAQHTHVAGKTLELLRRFGWKIFSQPPYSLDSAPSDYHLFGTLKEFLGGKQFSNEHELK